LVDTAAEVLKIFGPNVTDDMLHMRHKAIKIEDWVRYCFSAGWICRDFTRASVCCGVEKILMVNSTKKDYSQMSMLALEHFIHLAEREGDEYKPRLTHLGSFCCCVLCCCL
jgi:hypothetical protein